MPEKNHNVSELHTFLFEGLPVRGVVVRLTDAWVEILKRRAASSTGAYPEPVQNLLGEMVAAPERDLEVAAVEPPIFAVVLPSPIRCLPQMSQR